MAIGFGFSVSDLITGVGLIRDSVEAIRGKKSAPADYAALLTEINCLWDGLEAVEDLDLEHNGTEKQKVAIEHAITACQQCIDDFFTRISKYQPHLREGVSGWLSSYRKVKWALCRKEDVAKFRSKLERHASSINMLVITFHAKASMNQQARQDRQVVTLHSPPGDAAMASMLKGLSIEQRHFFEVLMQQNQTLLKSIEDLQRMLQIQSMIPAQVLLQQPVVLLDAFGKIAPFHLEFIDSSEAFLSVLKIRFRRAGARPNGLQKLDKGEFSLQETEKRRTIDIGRPWHTVFRPGQHVDMSMVFNRMTSWSKCPSCYAKNEDGEDHIECQRCGLSYRLCVEPLHGEAQPQQVITREPEYHTGSITPSNSESENRRTYIDTSGEHDAESFEGYRRVLINCVFVFDPEIQFPPPVNPFVTFLEIWLRLSPSHSGVPNASRNLPWWSQLCERVSALLGDWRQKASGPGLFDPERHWYRLASEVPIPNSQTDLLRAYFRSVDKALFDRYGIDNLQQMRMYYQKSQLSSRQSQSSTIRQAASVAAKMFLATHHSSSGSRIALEAGLQHPEEFDDFVYQGNNRPPTSLFIAAAVAGSNSSVANADSAVDNFSEDEETLRIRRHERALRNRQAQRRFRGKGALKQQKTALNVQNHTIPGRTNNTMLTEAFPKENDLDYSKSGNMAMPSTPKHGFAAEEPLSKNYIDGDTKTPPSAETGLTNVQKTTLEMDGISGWQLDSTQPQVSDLQTPNRPPKTPRKEQIQWVMLGREG